MAHEAQERLRGVVDPAIRAGVLAIRAELSFRMGERVTAGSLLAEAEALCGGDAPTRTEVARVRRLLAGG